MTTSEGPPAEAVEPPTGESRPTDSAPTLARLADFAVGMTAVASDGVEVVGRRVSGMVVPFGRVLLHPPLVGSRYQPGHWLGGISRRGNDELRSARAQLDRLLDALVPAVTAEVFPRVDLATLRGLVEEVVDAIDLPEIIRQSTGSMASETVRGARMQAVAADEAVARVVDRLFLRRNGRAVEGGTSAVREPASGER